FRFRFRFFQTRFRFVSVSDPFQGRAIRQSTPSSAQTAIRQSAFHVKTWDESRRLGDTVKPIFSPRSGGERPRTAREGGRRAHDHFMSLERALPFLLWRLSLESKSRDRSASAQAPAPRPE